VKKNKKYTERIFINIGLCVIIEHAIGENVNNYMSRIVWSYIIDVTSNIKEEIDYYIKNNL
jgi:hypothetical protein